MAEPMMPVPRTATRTFSPRLAAAVMLGLPLRGQGTSGAGGAAAELRASLDVHVRGWPGE